MDWEIERIIVLRLHLAIKSYNAENLYGGKSVAPVSKNPSSDGAAIPIPSYLIGVYEWAYVTPRAVKTFERQW